MKLLSRLELRKDLRDFISSIPFNTFNAAACSLLSDDDLDDFFISYFYHALVLLLVEWCDCGHSLTLRTREMIESREGERIMFSL